MQRLNGILLASLALLAGCDKAAAPANAATETQYAPTQRASYELVVETRPESVDNYFEHARALYQLCAAAAEANKLPVKPFMAIPKNFVTERRKMASDGERFLERTEGFSLDMDKAQPEHGCELGIKRTLKVDLYADGKFSGSGIGADGSYQTSPPEEMEPPDLDTAKLAAYPLDHNVNGVPLKCTGPSALVDGKGVCIVAPSAAKGQLATMHGQPLVAHMRHKDLALYKTVLVESPVSFRAGQPVNRGQFTLEAQR